MACSQERLNRERLALSLGQLGTFRVACADEAVTVEHLERARWAVARSAAWLCAGALLFGFAEATAQFQQLAAAAGVGAAIVGVALLVWALSVRSTRTQIVLSEDAAVRCLLLGVYGREPSVRRRRHGIVRRIHALGEAEVTMLPSVWDRVLGWVRRGA
ncbi:hypothetical protein [Leucobacter chromiireducens]|uniref:Uncharacterized protein n=1 Tax=Leucobacter chromiireducens subsp. solipictus TaxID=398235 RepID=A0ABS1SDD8_9MICO|nr:hypothetical protein [Leucobacter chromiireducens]MBL3678555.1 hypothetical protein [Leucobacter chromiireducens subsp. solipictus]